MIAENSIIERDINNCTNMQGNHQCNICSKVFNSEL